MWQIAVSKGTVRQCDGQREEIKEGKEEEVLHEVSRTHKVSGKQARGGCCEGGMVQTWVTVR